MNQIRQVNQNYWSFSQDLLAKWVGHQCMAILEDWGSAAELPAFSTCVHEQHKFVCHITTLTETTHFGSGSRGSSIVVILRLRSNQQSSLHNHKSFKRLQNPLYNLYLCYVLRTLDPRKKSGLSTTQEVKKQWGEKLSSSPLSTTGGGVSSLYPLGIVLVRYGVSAYECG